VGCATGTEVLLEATVEDSVRFPPPPAHLFHLARSPPTCDCMPRGTLSRGPPAAGQLLLRAINPAKSAYAAIRLRSSCFDTFRVTEHLQLGVYSKVRDRAGCRRARVVVVGTLTRSSHIRLSTLPGPFHSTCWLCCALPKWILSPSPCPPPRHRGSSCSSSAPRPVRDRSQPPRCETPTSLTPRHSRTDQDL
jgi:hypothetical protein